QRWNSLPSFQPTRLKIRQGAKETTAESTAWGVSCKSLLLPAGRHHFTGKTMQRGAVIRRRHGDNNMCNPSGDVALDLLTHILGAADEHSPALVLCGFPLRLLVISQGQL